MKMVFVKEEREENTTEPETWRIKHEEPETWRIKHEDPETWRIKQEEPEPQRIKHEEPETWRIKHEEPETRRIKHEEPETWRIKHEEPETWRIKQEEPEPQRIKQEEPEPQRIKHEEQGGCCLFCLIRDFCVIIQVQSDFLSQNILMLGCILNQNEIVIAIRQKLTNLANNQLIVSRIVYCCSTMFFLFCPEMKHVFGRKMLVLLLSY